MQNQLECLQQDVTIEFLPHGSDMPYRIVAYNNPIVLRDLDGHSPDDGCHGFGDDDNDSSDNDDDDDSGEDSGGGTNNDMGWNSEPTDYAGDIPSVWDRGPSPEEELDTWFDDYFDPGTESISWSNSVADSTSFWVDLMPDCLTFQIGWTSTVGHGIAATRGAGGIMSWNGTNFDADSYVTTGGG